MNHPHILTVDRLDDGIVLTFSNSRVLFFTAEYLWSIRKESEEPLPSKPIAMDAIVISEA